MKLDDFLVADSFETAGVGTVENYFLNHWANQARGKYFFEAGAVNGFHLSQTATLEKKHGWSGLLVEPHRELFERLEKGRGANNFCLNEALGDGGVHWFEEKTQGHFGHSQIRPKHGPDCIRAGTVTVEEALTVARAPARIDFAVLDVEDAFELVLSGIDFFRRSFGFLAVEVKGARGSAIVEKMAGHGYKLARILGGEDFCFVPE